MISLTDDLTALVTRATEALARGETVRLGEIEIGVRDGTVEARCPRRGVFAYWSNHARGRRDVLREAIFAALKVAP